MYGGKKENQNILKTQNPTASGHVAEKKESEEKDMCADVI